MKVYLKSLQIILLLFFTAVVLLPTLNKNLHLIEESKGNENRTKVKEPDFDSLSLGNFVKAYDDYYSDNFNLRQNFITLHNVFEYLTFDVSPVPKDIVIGKQDWFYDVNCIPNYKGANLFTEKQMLRLKDELALRTQWASEAGARYYMVIVPDKMSVYPEFLPNSVVKLSDSTRYEQLVSLDNGHSINVIGLKNNLLKHKNEGEYLYQHTDGHWNDLGAYYGYQEIMNRLKKDFPELSPFTINDYTISHEERNGGLAIMANLEKYCPEHFVALTEKYKVYGHDGQKRGYKVPPTISEWDYEIIKANENGKKLKCLIIRDSFTLLMIRYLQEHFSESVFMHDEWKARMREDLILKEKPDIVLNIMVETYADRLLEFPFAWNKNNKLEKNIQLQASNGKFICAETDHLLYANKDAAAYWETYTMITMPDNKCAFLSYNGSYLSADLGHLNEITTDKEKMSEWETFSYIKTSDGFVAFKAANGKYLTFDAATSQIRATADQIGEREKFRMIKR